MCVSERNDGNEVVIKTVEIQFDLNVVKVLQEALRSSLIQLGRSKGIQSQPCSPNAFCHENGSRLVCACNLGYQGDGYNEDARNHRSYEHYLSTSENKA